MKKVLNKYRQVAKYIDREIKIKKGNEWACYVEDKIITIPQIESEEGNAEFRKSIEKILPITLEIDIISDEMWSLLHEVGHIQKGKRYNDNIIRGLANIFSKLSLNRLANAIYFNLKEEKEATQWAVNYVNKNVNIVQRFDRELGKTYRNFFRSMNLELE